MRRLYIKSLEKDVNDDVTNDFNLSLNIDIKIRRVSGTAGADVIISDKPDAIPLKIEEADIREKFPWDYGILSKRLQDRYSDFKVAQKYYAIKKRLEQDPKLCNTRYLDPGNPKSATKKFYSPNIVREFDKHYKRMK